jgi:nucleoside-diphosphate-sugar epimerase
MTERYLVTGAMGCLGAWVTHTLRREGAEVVSFDLSPNRARFDLIVDEAELAGIEFIVGDLTNRDSVEQAIASTGVTRVIHCAALQIPFVRANPPLGAQVNVTGTVNVFEAVRQHRDQIAGFAWASAAGVFGTPELYPDGVVRDDSLQHPMTLYGVFKQADEGIARIYWQDHGVASVGLRPWVIYGIGRDQGLTSSTTIALLAAAARRPYEITYAGTTLFQYAPDAAAAFVAAARAQIPGPEVFNLPGAVASIADFVAAIELARPAARGLITFAGDPLPVVARVDTARLESMLPLAPITPLQEGVAETISRFEALIERGLLT